MPHLALTDPDDPRVAGYHGVRDPDLLRAQGVFIAEGRLVVEQLLTGGRFPVRSALVTETARQALAGALARHPDLPVYVVPTPLVHAIAGFHIHQGCLALGARIPGPDWRAVAAAATRLLVLEAVGNPDNVGGLFRNARALGAGGVLLGPGCADPLYRKAIRTSMGATLEVPFAQAPDWPATLEALTADGWAVLAATPAPAALPLAEAARRVAGRRVAVVVGHEGDGLTAAARAACPLAARIPMTPGVDSLNVSAAAAVILYELSRDA